MASGAPFSHFHMPPTSPQLPTSSRPTLSSLHIKHTFFCSRATHAPLVSYSPNLRVYTFERINKPHLLAILSLLHKIVYTYRTGRIHSNGAVFMISASALSNGLRNLEFISNDVTASVVVSPPMLFTTSLVTF